jgi:TrmH family RNA methyltransferase
MMHLKSLKNPIIQKALRIRTDKSFRQSEGLCLVFGDHLLQELSQTHPIEVLFSTDPYQNLPAKETFFISKEIFEKILGVSSHDRWIALLPIPPLSLAKGTRVLIFDRLQDPGNVGTLLRSMEAFGFDLAFFLDSCVDPFNEKVIRASMGAVFRVPLRKGSLEDLLDLNLTLLGADMDGDPIERFFPKEPFGLILGHEGQGLQEKIKKLVKKVKIPMLPPTESLNVSQAGAILLYFLGKSRGL